MAQVSLPYTLTAGTPENVNNLVANLNALVAGVNTVDTAQIANNAVTRAKLATDIYPVFAVSAGDSYGGATETTVTFPSGRFSHTPVLAFSNGDGYKRIRVTAASATQFKWQCEDNLMNVTLNWIAIQMTSSASAG